MKNYTYRFNDGTTKTIEVEDKLYETLKEQDRKEQRNKWVIEKHTISLDYLKDEGVEFGADADNPLLLLIKQEDLQEFENKLVCLTQKQRKVLYMFLDGMTVVQISNELGNAHQVISKCLAASFKKLKKFY